MEQPSTSTRNEGARHTAKKMVQRKPPVIKQTLTSMYRIAKANPLLVLRENTTTDQPDDFGVNNIKLPRSVLLPVIRSTSDNDKLTVDCKPSSSNLTVKSSVVKSSVNKNEQKSTTFFRTTSLKVKKGKCFNNNVQLKRTNSVNIQPISKIEPKCETRCIYHHNKVSSLAVTSKLLNNIPKTSTSSTSKLSTADEQLAPKKKRRSLSAEHYDRKRGVCIKKTVPLADMREVTQSLNDIEKKVTLIPPAVSPIVEEVRTVTFKTPSAHRRRSRSATTTAFPKHFASTPCPSGAAFPKHFASTPRPLGDDLQQRLEEWLRVHHKPVDSYKHLKCFGLHRSSHDSYSKLDEENKENVEEFQLTESTSYEDLRIIPKNSTTVTTGLMMANGNGNNYTHNRTIAQDALRDLHKLILDGYSHQQCEAWLGMIRQKYQDLDEEPQYWECRAAIEQTRGNITSAVECLRTAIVQGAEVKTVDHCLEQLLHKFSLLNISTSDTDTNNTKGKDRARIVLDARSVFKSSIIQFAVQERTMKKKQMQEGTTSEKKVIATPVRRSTRQRRSIYTSTPGVTLYSSLHELDANVSNSLDFHGNSALLDKLYH